MDTHNLDWKSIETQMIKRNINGKSLQHFNDSRLDMIGIQDFNIAVFLMKQITTLRNKYRLNDDNDNGNDKENDNGIHKNKIPSKFICPITKQIMKDPVIAFDENIYERSAIEKYLKENNTSPITDEEAYTLSLFSNKQLKKEIQAYCAVNNVITDEGTSINEGNDTAYLQ